MADDETTALIDAIYSAFNKRDSSFVIQKMSPAVRWPRAFEGDFVTGQEAVRDYWEHQWQEIDPHVEPQSIVRLDDGRVDVEVHQVVHDLAGALLVDGVVHHVYELDGTAIVSMEVSTGKVDLGPAH